MENLVNELKEKYQMEVEYYPRKGKILIYDFPAEAKNELESLGFTFGPGVARFSFTPIIEEVSSPSLSEKEAEKSHQYWMR